MSASLSTQIPLPRLPGELRLHGATLTYLQVYHAVLDGRLNPWVRQGHNGRYSAARCDLAAIAQALSRSSIPAA